MRKVEIPHGATPPAEWLKKAQALTQALRDAKTEDERKAIIEKNDGLWREAGIRDWLLALFNNKCWYTEAYESVSPTHVDHYRPKGRVSDIAMKNLRDGYWWLAFEWTNYRICGALPNSKKSDMFPLKEGHPATSEDANSLKLEAPVIIDPITDDAWLVSYEMDEEVCLATFVPGADEPDKERVAATIDILGLNRLSRLNQKRAAVWQKCREHIQQYLVAANEPHCIKSVMQAKVVADLKSLIDYNTEFSSVAYACISKTAPDALKAKVRC